MNAPAKTYAETIYGQLREEILRGDLRPGDRLTEQEIARRMGTSQGPVREALARLRAQGLVLALPHRGSFVSEISADHARDIYQVRLLVEREAARLAFPRITEADVDALRARVEILVAHADDQDFLATIGRDMSFHRCIFELAGSPTLLGFWDILETQITKFVAVASPAIFRDPVRIAKTHYPLLDAIAARDVARFAEELEAHVFRIWEHFDRDGRPEPAASAHDT